MEAFFRMAEEKQDAYNELRKSHAELFHRLKNLVTIYDNMMDGDITAVFANIDFMSAREALSNAQKLTEAK